MNIENLMDENIEVKQIDAGTWMISEGIGRSRAHCYVIEGSQQVALIDTGLHQIEMSKIVKGLSNREIIVLSTHGHIDHVSNHHQFDQIYLNSKDDELYKIAYNSKWRESLLKGWFMSKGLTKSELVDPSVKEYLIKQTHLPSRKAYNELSEHQMVDLGDRLIEVIETPGHTEGSVCLLDGQSQRLFVGDMICEDGVLLHLKESTSVLVYLQSLEKLLMRKAEFSVLYAGHQLVPLPVSILEDFIECAKLIIDNQDQIGNIAVKEQGHYSIKHKRARLTIPA